MKLTTKNLTHFLLKRSDGLCPWPWLVRNALSAAVMP